MRHWISIILIMTLVVACAQSGPTSKSQDTKFRCETDADCTSTCGAGCVNTDWAQNYKDTCVNIRAFDCSCVQNTCYTDGNAPKK